MRSPISKLLVALLSISLFAVPVLAANSSAREKNMSDIVEKINELKTMEKLINQKLAQLEKEKKAIEEEKKQIDAYVKKKKEELDKYIQQKQKELEALKKRIASEKIKKLASIYSNAKPQAAAEELSRMNEDLAAQILIFMQPRKAGAIISKMNPQKASEIFQRYINKKSTLKESRTNTQ